MGDFRLKISLDYMVSSKPAWATEKSPLSNKQQTKNKTKTSHCELWENGSVSEALAAQGWGSKFESPGVLQELGT